jgi:hypothetical protein
LARKDMRKALGASLKAEEQAVRSRFQKADAALEKGRASAAVPTDGEGKVIRDSFTMPVPDYDLIAKIKRRCLKGQASVTKSEVLRAGLLALDAMSDRELLKTVGALTKVKTGRPPRKGLEE